jgi:hypothetical protein
MTSIRHRATLVERRWRSSKGCRPAGLPAGWPPGRFSDGCVQHGGGPGRGLSPAAGARASGRRTCRDSSARLDVLTPTEVPGGSSASATRISRPHPRTRLTERGASGLPILDCPVLMLLGLLVLPASSKPRLRGVSHQWACLCSVPLSVALVVAPGSERARVGGVPRDRGPDGIGYDVGGRHLDRRCRRALGVERAVEAGARRSPRQGPSVPRRLDG